MQARRRICEQPAALTAISRISIRGGARDRVRQVCWSQCEGSVQRRTSLDKPCSSRTSTWWMARHSTLLWLHNNARHAAGNRRGEKRNGSEHGPAAIS